MTSGRLIVTLPLDAKLTPMQSKSLLENALAEYVESCYQKYLIEVYGNEERWAKLRRSNGKIVYEDPYPEAVPDVPECDPGLIIQSPEPAQPEQRPASPSSPGSSSSIASIGPKDCMDNVEGGENTTFVGDPGLQSPRRRTMRTRRQRRLSFTSTNDFAVDISRRDLSGKSSIKTCKNEADVLDSMPSELRRRSLEGIISMSSLHKLEHNELEHRRLSGSEAVASREKNAAIRSLPNIMQRVRTIFGRPGPKVLKLEILAQKVRDGGFRTASVSDITKRLHVLADHAPEFLQIKPWGDQDPTPAAWINRDCDYTAVLHKLNDKIEPAV